ncbi:MAG: FkbM family methyltransferase [Elusimicrobia bacterium]|nr:FkbM family methyltransferase [Elusimicrobiota bacterium]
MDIEGAEYAAIQGMSNLLKENKNIKIIAEFNPFILRGAGIEPAEYLKLLLTHGFKLYDVSNEKKKLVNVADINELLEIYTPEKMKWTNLLCVRCESQ